MEYKYIIMCGGDYEWWSTPKQLSLICGEPLIVRTLRMLKEAGANDIAISSNNPMFDGFGVDVLHHDNPYSIDNDNNEVGTWVDAFYPVDTPVCYVFGDVVFSPEAIKIIVETDTTDIEFFASAPPFAKNYMKPWAEPFAFKVKNTKHFRDSISKVRELQHKFKRDPIAWELWQVIKGTPINKINYTNYTVINDYTCDIDKKRDIEVFNRDVFHYQSLV